MDYNELCKRATTDQGLDPVIACKTCGAMVDPLAVFPGGICLECYKVTPDATRPLTADAVTRLWGGK